jgi:hypothetical protein
MTNHFHLVVRPEPGQPLSRAKQSLAVAHTWRYHKRHGSSGHVWQGRFKAPAIEGGEHLLAVLRYVEANPLRAGMGSREGRTTRGRRGSGPAEGEAAESGRNLMRRGGGGHRPCGATSATASRPEDEARGRC